MNNINRAENTKMMENRKEDKGAFKKFILILIVALFLGGFVGYFSVASTWSVHSLAEGLLRVLSVIAPFEMLVVTTLVLIGVLVIEHSCRKAYAGWDGENETTLNKIERELSYGLIANSMNLILSYFFVGVGFYGFEREFAQGSRSEKIALIKVMVMLVGLVYTLVVCILLQKQLVNLEKEINPEKRGSVYDLEFNKRWLESCDEAERLQIYKSAYSSYRMTNTACIILWVICLVGLMSWDFGLLPMTMVILLWAISNIGYFKESLHLTRHPEEIMK